MFPLRRADGGVLVRAGQTEAAVDLARIAGLYPAGVICEIMNEDGTMARVPELTKFAQAAQAADDHDRGSDQVPDAHRGAGAAASRRRSCRPSTASSACIAFESQLDSETHVALVRGEIGDGEDVLVRVHSRCLTGDVLPLVALRLRRAARRGDGRGSRRKGAACCST